ncbi:DUF58 domain-containing protein [Aeromonas taiwanensis]|uniref:DUF58 domain-containing protein n=1 Tax=Aeromonas taiwanensis TaxID=633417 RepID=UPI00207D073B|nr:DUF58 domain-containing protein [Aeromonas taiwanensis]MCO4205694.1 DUF58 domain-containing protein [Aeromonas taiwanensis]
MTALADPRAHPDIALPLARLLAVRLWARSGERARIHLAHQGRVRRQPGLSFRELRVYQAGDEVRHIDWRVTARLGRPHTRLYGEEQEQTHWLLLDLSPDMYFGSGAQLKARLGCELAAALLWQGEKQANTLVCHGLETRPLHQHGSLMPLLEALCRHYEAGLDRASLNHPLAHTLAGLTLPHGASLTLISHHQPPDPGLCKQLQRLGQRHDIHYWQIRDPLEATLPGQGRLAVAAGRRSGWLDGGLAHFRERYQKAAREQAATSQQQLMPLVTRLYRLDNGEPLQRQWQEGGCRLF